MVLKVRSMKIKRLSVLILMLILLSACSHLPIPMDTMPWANNNPVYFRDDFSQNSGGWSVFDSGLGFAKYDQGGLRLGSEVENYQIWSSPGLNFADVQIFTQSTKLSGTDDNLFGILCRYQDRSNFYAFVIGSDGYYGIFKMVQGQQSLIKQPHMDFSPVIKPGSEINKIQALCKGDQLALVVNDNVLLRVQDDTLSHGDVGLMVGNFSQPGVDILFDNFIVVKP